ncbi:MAG TPA: tetratricopeptide repeat protein [Methylomirabilota bacterium]|nr:tetratricopeptide repeat protein [Methylomirabilota bacterium]
MMRLGRLGLLLAPLVFLITAVVFLPALRGEFLNWDDSVNFVANPSYRGLGWPQIRWMLTATLMGHYIPLTWLSFGLDYALGGMNPWGYHLTSLILHAANATLVYLIARRLLAAAWGGGSQDGHATGPVVVAAAFGALVWAVHPLRVESVAWITERRDVLCGLFFLLAVLAYLKGLERGGDPRPAWRALSLAAFAAALLSKAAAMPLPAVLLLLDLYPLRRRGAGWRRLIVEKAPYAALAAVTAVVALIALPRGAGVTSYQSYGVVARIGMVAYSFVFYPMKFVLPIRLSPMYELPARVDLASWPFLPALVVVAGVTTALVLARPRWPGGLAAWTYSALMVLPISGVVHAGSQLVNDRYSYLSGVGFAVLAGAGVLGVLRLRERGRATMTTVAALVGGAALIVLALGLAAWTQTQVWRDSETLWRWAVEMDPGCSLCHGNLGSAITTAELGQARLDEAEVHLRRAIELRPDNPIPHFNLGTLLLVRARYDEADAVLQQYLALLPGSPNGLGRLGLLYLLRGRLEDAVPLLLRARGLPPGSPGGATPAPLATAIALVEDDPGALMLLGRALVEQGKPGDAILALERAARLAPSAVPARFWLVHAYRSVGRADLAEAQLDALRRLDPRAAAGLPVR